MGLFSGNKQGAVISRCKNYRYVLWRDLGLGDRRVLFIMLNPSTADAKQDDPTIRRLKNYAVDWGYSELSVCNLFAYRATYPVELRESANPIGSENDSHILKQANQADLIVCAWGNHGQLNGRAKAVVRMLEKAGKELFCLSMTRANEPGHPLYLKKDLSPKRIISHAGLLQTDIEHFTDKHLKNSPVGKQTSEEV